MATIPAVPGSAAGPRPKRRQSELKRCPAWSSHAWQGCPGSSGHRRRRARKRSRANSNSTDEQVDALQYELDEGPCLTAWRTQQLVRIDDTTTDARWPRWNEAASALGVRSVLSAPLLADGGSIGAMKVYSERPTNYGPHDEHVMRLLAAQAAILLANSQSLAEARRLSRQLADALARRDDIAQATGVLLGRGAVNRQDAFAALAATARRSDRPVQDVASALLAAVTARNSRTTAPEQPRAHDRR